MKRKKLLTLLATSSLLISGAAVFAATSASGLATLDTRASEVEGSIVFSRATGDVYKIDDRSFSVSGKTSLGATYYAVSHNNSDAYDSEFIAKFGMGEGYDEQFIQFSSDKEGTDFFKFQNLTGIKVTTASASQVNIYAYWSEDGTTWPSGNQQAIACSSSPSKVNFTTSVKCLKFGLGSIPPSERKIVSVELFYECSTGGEKVVESIEIDGEATVKNDYVVQDDFVPAPVKVTYEGGDTEDITIPAGVETSDYVFSANALENGREEATPREAEMKVAFDGNDVYFQGFVVDLPEKWAKGTLSEDGKTVTISSLQYLGQQNIMDWFIFDYYLTAVDDEGHNTDIVFNYDADTQKFTTNQTIVLTDKTEPYWTFTNVVIAKPGSTGIEHINTTKDNKDTWYNLNGVRIAQPTEKGLYIHNGRKVMLR